MKGKEELISADHVARVVNRVVDLLDIRELTSQEKIEGHPAYHLEKAEKAETDYYVTSGRWEEEVQERSIREKEEAKAIVNSFANSPLQKGVGVAKEKRVIFGFSYCL
jgi:hypothetical protein